MTAAQSERETLRSLLADLRRLSERFHADSISRSAGELCSRLERSRFHLVVAGQFKRGKTTLLNALLGRELLPAAVLPLTSAVTMLHYGPEIQAEIVLESGARLPIRTEQLAEFVTERGNPKNFRRVSWAEIACPNDFLREGLVLIDTPGIGSVYKHNTQVTCDFLPRIDGAIFVTSPEPPLGEVELQFLKELKERSGRLFLVLNKADQMEPRELAEVLAFTREAAQEDRIFAVSARLALEAKLRADSALLESSGLPAFEKELQRFLHREKNQVLLASVLRGARQQMADLRLELSLEIQAARLPVQELDAKASELQRELQHARQQQEESSLLLHGAIDRLRAWVDAEAARFAAAEAGPLSAAVEAYWRQACGLPRNQFAKSMDGFVQRAILERCDAWRGVLEPAAAAQLREITGRFEERTNKLIRSVCEIAGRLFGISVPELAAGGELIGMEGSGYYTDPLLDWGLGSAPLLLPPPLFRQYLLRRLRRAAPAELERNSNRVAIDLKRRLEKSVALFQEAMNRRLEETVQALERALASAVERRQASAAEAGAGLEELTSGICELERLAERAGRLDAAATIAAGSGSESYQSSRQPRAAQRSCGERSRVERRLSPCARVDPGAERGASNV